jgi:hypothetical protein
MARRRRLTAGELAILEHFTKTGGGRRVHGQLEPLTQQTAHELAPRAVPPPPTTARINPYGQVSGGALGAPAAVQTQAAPALALLGAVANPGINPPNPVRTGLAPTGLLPAFEKTRVAGINEDLGEPADLVNAIVAAATLGGSAYLGGALKGGEAAAEGLGAGAASEGTSTATRTAEAIVKAATAPVRHPVLTASSPAVAQIPQAVAEGSPTPVLHGIAGTGVLAGALGSAGGGIRGTIPGVLGNALGDAVELPAQVLPSTYLTLKAGGNAALGNSDELKELTKSFGASSALVALARGEFGPALERAGEHPLYTLLEGAGVRSAAGHGLGTALRHAPSEATRARFAAGRQRPDLNIFGDVAEHRGPYSNDALARRRQERQDAKRAPADKGRVAATNAEIIKYLHSAVDREVYGSEVVRKGKQAEAANLLKELQPSRRGRHRGQFASKAGKADDLVASLQAQGIVSPDPAQARLDLAKYRAKLIDAQPRLSPSELKVNRRNVKALDEAIAHGTLDHVELARAAAEQGRGVQQQLVDAGLLTHDQAEKAKAIPYARAHMNADYGLSNADLAELARVKAGLADGTATIGELSRVKARQQTLDEHGNALSTDQIHAHMTENGFDPELLAYVTHQLPREEGMRASGYYAPPTERPSLLSKKRTGEAVSRGTHDFSFDALLNQAIHGRTVADRLHNFEHFAERVGLRRPDGRAFESTQEARNFAEHPDDFGAALPPVPGGYVPFRLAPFLAKSEVLEAVKGVGGNRAEEETFPELQTFDSHEGEEFLGETLAKAKEDGDGPVVLVPKVAANRFEEHFQKASTGEKLAQAATTAFKGAVLPTSISWFAGNAIDNWIVRTLGTGLTPLDIRSGKAFGRLIHESNSPEEASRAIESIITGGQYGSVPKIQPYRDAAQFETSRVYPFVKAAHDLLEAPGVKTVANAYRHYRDAVFHLDGRYVEQSPQYAALSRAARKEVGLTRRQWRKAISAQDPVVVDLAKGFRDPDKVDYFAKQVERVFGNWGKNGPTAKKYLNTYAPFWQWARAATKFALVTLPKDHPTLTALIAASEQMTREEREKLGFDVFSTERLPDYLQGSIPDPLEPGGVLSVGHLTTFGEFGNYTEAIGSNFLPPVLQNAYLGSIGVDWKGERLMNADGQPANELERAKAAIFGTAESFAPFLNLGKSIGSHGAAGLSPARSYSPESIAAQRTPREEISVPVEGGGSDGSNPYDGDFGGGGATENPYEGSFGSSSVEENPYAGAFGG